MRAITTCMLQARLREAHIGMAQLRCQLAERAAASRTDDYAQDAPSGLTEQRAGEHHECSRIDHQSAQLHVQTSTVVHDAAYNAPAAECHSSLGVAVAGTPPTELEQRQHTPLEVLPLAAPDARWLAVYESVLGPDHGQLDALLQQERGDGSLNLGLASDVAAAVGLG